MTKLRNIHDGITGVISSFSFMISLEDLSNILNLILLIFSLFNIFIMLFFRIRSIIKNKGINEDSLKEINKEINETIEDINDKIDSNN